MNEEQTNRLMLTFLALLVERSGGSVTIEFDDEDRDLLIGFEVRGTEVRVFTLTEKARCEKN